jgi:hypothetical protein
MVLATLPQGARGRDAFMDVESAVVSRVYARLPDTIASIQGPAVLTKEHETFYNELFGVMKVVVMPSQRSHALSYAVREAANCYVDTYVLHKEMRILDMYSSPVKAIKRFGDPAIHYDVVDFRDGGRHQSILGMPRASLAALGNRFVTVGDCMKRFAKPHCAKDVYDAQVRVCRGNPNRFLVACKGKFDALHFSDVLGHIPEEDVFNAMHLSNTPMAVCTFWCVSKLFYGCDKGSEARGIYSYRTVRKACGGEYVTMSFGDAQNDYICRKDAMMSAFRNRLQMYRGYVYHADIVWTKFDYCVKVIRRTVLSPMMSITEQHYTMRCDHLMPYLRIPLYIDFLEKRKSVGDYSVTKKELDEMEWLDVPKEVFEAFVKSGSVVPEKEYAALMVRLSIVKFWDNNQVTEMYAKLKRHRLDICLATFVVGEQNKLAMKKFESVLRDTCDGMLMISSFSQWFRSLKFSISELFHKIKGLFVDDFNCNPENFVRYYDPIDFCDELPCCVSQIDTVRSQPDYSFVEEVELPTPPAKPLVSCIVKRHLSSDDPQCFGGYTGKNVHDGQRKLNCVDREFMNWAFTGVETLVIIGAGNLGSQEHISEMLHDYNYPVTYCYDGGNPMN